MPKQAKREEYAPDEVERRFEAALRGAFVTTPKPMKDIPRKRRKAKRKPSKRATASV